MTLQPLWKRRVEAQAQRTKPAHELPLSFKGIQRATQRELDIVGTMLKLTRQEAYGIHECRVGKSLDSYEPWQRNEVYRDQLMFRVEYELREMRERVRYASRTFDDELPDQLEMLARLLGLDVEQQHLHERCLVECSWYFDGPPFHLRKPS